MKILLIIFLLLSSVAANEPTGKHIKMPLAQALPLLEPLEKDAITIGAGPIKVYAFVDPLCPHSRNFMEVVFSNPTMQKRYTYRFFLYTLPRLKSEKMVVTIYGTKAQDQSLKQVMVDKIALALTPSTGSIDAKVARIAKVAKKLDVYKRPYLILVKHKKVKP